MRAAIEASLDRYSSEVEGCPPRLGEAIRYSLLAPGKRFRPLLVLLSCQATGGQWSAALPIACAVEMVHAYSLVHDDLPAMDDDDLRRGRPTCHRAYDEATAILVGDSLQMLAMEVLTAELPPAMAARCCHILAVAAGRSRLVGGQADDLAAEGRYGALPLTSEDEKFAFLRAIHLRKTAALIEASAELGGVASDAPLDHVNRLKEYGKNIGLAFQIVDDCLDIDGLVDQLGKRTGKDRTAGKLTFPSLIGLERSRAMARELVDAAIATISPLGERAAALVDLANFIVSRTS